LVNKTSAFADVCKYKRSIGFIGNFIKQNLDIRHKLKSLCNAITHEKEKLKSNILHNSISTKLTLPKLGIW